MASELAQSGMEAALRIASRQPGQPRIIFVFAVADGRGFILRTPLT